MAHFTKPGVIHTINLSLNIDEGNRKELLRGVFLQVKYDGCEYTSVNAPTCDFFCDSFDGDSMNFSGLVMAKRPTDSLFSYTPMPFKKEIKISLVNKTNKRVTGYGYVTAESIPGWESDFGYFHTNWKDKTVKLPEDIVPLLNTKGSGHFFGCHLTAESSYLHFGENQGICEGNDEFYMEARINDTITSEPGTSLNSVGTGKSSGATITLGLPI